MPSSPSCAMKRPTMTERLERLRRALEDQHLAVRGRVFTGPELDAARALREELCRLHATLQECEAQQP